MVWNLEFYFACPASRCNLASFGLVPLFLSLAFEGIASLRRCQLEYVTHFVSADLPERGGPIKSDVTVVVGISCKASQE